MDCYSEPIVYAVKHKNFTTRMLSRSGGMFTAVSDFVLNNGGVVYGCILSDDFKAIHVSATTVDERNKMRGSKYIQSEIGEVYKKIKIDLSLNKMVLFSGTSCQVAGLKSYLGKDFNNLLCLDILCFGVPSPYVFNRYVKWQEKKNKAKCNLVDFRNKKDFGWEEHIETLYMKNKGGTIKVNSSVFRNLFLGRNILRPSCYKCPYKDVMHPSDITIGDFWGIENAVSGFNDNYGVSLVLINNEKGKRVFDSIKDLDFFICNLKDSLQPVLIEPFSMPLEREEFWKDFNMRSFDYIAEKYADYPRHRFFSEIFHSFSNFVGRYKNYIFGVLGK